MPAAESYTEAELKTFMVNALGGAGAGVAGALGLTTSSAAIASAVLAVERILGVSDTADLTDMAKLEAVATWRAWSAAADVAATSFDLSSSGDSLKLSQMLEGIRYRLASAYDAAAIYGEVQEASGAGGTLVLAEIGGTQSPYSWSEF